MNTDKLSNEDVIAGNKLIAEFMGARYHELEDTFNVEKVMWYLPSNNPNPHCSIGTYKRLSELDYHIRWDWLMPVVEKIETGDGVRVDIYQLGCKIFRHGKLRATYAAETKIKAVWHSVVEFITWYNTNLPEQVK